MHRVDANGQHFRVIETTRGELSGVETRIARAYRKMGRKRRQFRPAVPANLGKIGPVGLKELGRGYVMVDERFGSMVPAHPWRDFRSDRMVINESRIGWQRFGTGKAISLVGHFRGYMSGKNLRNKPPGLQFIPDPDGVIANSVAISKIRQNLMNRRLSTMRGMELNSYFG